MPSRTGKYQPIGVGMTPSKTELGKFLRAHRITLELSQTKVAKLSGMSQTLYSALEVGDSEYLNTKHLQGLARTLQCNESQLRAVVPQKHQTQPKTECGRLIRSRREELGLSLEQFAERLGISPRRAKSLEVRKAKLLRYKLVEPLAKALELDQTVISKFVRYSYKETSSSLGRLIRTQRTELGLSIRGLAKRLDVSIQYVNQIEFGLSSLNRNDKMIERLATILKLDVAKLKEVRSKRRLKKSMTDPNTLGGFLTARRLELDLSQRELAERAGTGTKIVSAIETGRKKPDQALLSRLAKALECEVPLELIPKLEKFKTGPKLGFVRQRITPLGQFITQKRIALGLTQAEFAKHAQIGEQTVVSLEIGKTNQPGPTVLEKVSAALGCEIPAEFLPRYERRLGSKVRRETVLLLAPDPSSIRLTDSAKGNLDKIRELSDSSETSNEEIARKAFEFLRRMLEKQQEGFAICLVKGEKTVELELLL